jgi:hypothetical protein
MLAPYRTALRLVVRASRTLSVFAVGYCQLLKAVPEHDEVLGHST